MTHILTLLDSNKSAQLTDLSNEVRSGDDNAKNASEIVAGTAVCARVQCAYEATCAVDSNGQPRLVCLLYFGYNENYRLKV